MTKQELIKKHRNGELKAIASTHITNTSGLAICHIEHGIDDKIFGYVSSGEAISYFFVKLQYLTENIIFKVGNLKFDLDQIARI